MTFAGCFPFCFCQVSRAQRSFPCRWTWASPRSWNPRQARRAPKVWPGGIFGGEDVMMRYCWFLEISNRPYWTDPEKTWASNNSIATYEGKVRWDSVPFNFWWIDSGQIVSDFAHRAPRKMGPQIFPSGVPGPGGPVGEIFDHTILFFFGQCLAPNFIYFASFVLTPKCVTTTI